MENKGADSAVNLRDKIELVRKDQAKNNAQSIDLVQETQETARKLAEYIQRSNVWQGAVIDCVKRTYWEDAARPTNTYATEELTGYAAWSKHLVDRFSSQLLQYLHYPEMGNRYEVIAQAHAETFQWIFNDVDEVQSRSSLTAWLQDSKESLYWITGKPGSGKSTLMKFISDDGRTTTFLNRWASGEQLLIFSFYFWSSGPSGTEVQMDQEGLFRTLLFNALEKYRHLIPLVFRSRLEAFMVLGDSATWQGSWSRQELLRAVRLLVREATKQMKMVFFIDGLDEFRGSQLELVDLIVGLSGPNIKICVSSRPWPVFEDAFRQKPSLRMETLTYSDISNYVTSTLSSSPGFCALQRLDQQGADELVKDVTDRALGVFLWVYLVTQSLIEGLTDGDRLSDLKLRLQSLPSDITALFQKILDSLNPSHFSRASELFQILRASIGPLSLLRLSFAEEDDPEFAFKLPIAPMTTEKEELRAELTRRRVTSYSKCLLEVEQKSGPSLAVSHVRFLHRTVKDFLDSPGVWDQVLKGTDNRFNPNVCLCAARIARIKTFPSDIAFKSYDSHGAATRRISSRMTVSARTREHTDPAVYQEMMYGIEHAVRADTNYTAIQARLLNEINRAGAEVTQVKTVARTLLSITGSVPGEELEWACSHQECHNSAAFLYLAITCKLLPHIKESLSALPQQCQAAYLQRFLWIAASKNTVFRKVMETGVERYHRVDLKLVQFLLDFGADPGPLLANQAFRDIFSREHEHQEDALLRMLEAHEARAKEQSTKWKKRLSESWKRCRTRWKESKGKGDTEGR